MLYVYRRIIFGKLEKENLMSISDLSYREVIIFVPLVFGFLDGDLSCTIPRCYVGFGDNLIKNFNVALENSSVILLVTTRSHRL